jgi:hypothetical protein
VQVRGVSSDLETNATVLATKLYSTLDKLWGTRKNVGMNEEGYPMCIKHTVSKKEHTSHDGIFLTMGTGRSVGVHTYLAIGIS